MSSRSSSSCGIYPCCLASAIQKWDMSTSPRLDSRKSPCSASFGTDGWWHEPHRWVMGTTRPCNHGIVFRFRTRSSKYSASFHYQVYGPKQRQRVARVKGCGKQQGIERTIVVGRTRAISRWHLLSSSCFLTMIMMMLHGTTRDRYLMML